MNLEIKQKGRPFSSQDKLINGLELILKSHDDIDKASVFYIEPSLINTNISVSNLVEEYNKEASKAQGYICRSTFHTKFDYEKIEVFKDANVNQSEHQLIAVIK